MEIAIGGSEAPTAQLKEYGWVVRDPLSISLDLNEYQSYIQRSKGEFSIAKHGYVTTQCGWFSERSACYLASGRPVVVQDTGYTRWLRSDFGVCRFSDANEAVSALEEVNSNYALHSEAARAVAEQYFDSHRILTDLVDQCMA